LLLAKPNLKIDKPKNRTKGYFATQPGHVATP